MKRVPITKDFNHQQPIGLAYIDVHSLYINIEDYVFAPGFILHEDGTQELTEISLIPVARVHKRSPSPESKS